MQDMDNIVQRGASTSLISAVKERMSILRHQTRDFEAWRKSISKEAVSRKTLEQIQLCTTECEESMRLLIKMLVAAEKVACEFVSVHSQAFADVVDQIKIMHFYVSRQQEMMNVASLGLLFPERDIDVIRVDPLALESRTADFYIAYSLNKIDTFHNELETKRVAIQDTPRLQSSSSDPSGMWLSAKIQFLDTHMAHCKDRAEAISSLHREFHLNENGQRIISGDVWDVVESATQSAQMEIIIWQHLYAVFFSTMSGGYQLAMDMQGMVAH